MKTGLLTLIAFAIGGAGLAMADGDFEHHSREIECGSHNYQYTTCHAGGGHIRYIRLIRQESHAACIQGSTFGFEREHVWVNRGCRGLFEVTFHHHDFDAQDETEEIQN